MPDITQARSLGYPVLGFQQALFPSFFSSHLLGFLKKTQDEAGLLWDEIISYPQMISVKCFVPSSQKRKTNKHRKETPLPNSLSCYPKRGRGLNQHYPLIFSLCIETYSVHFQYAINGKNGIAWWWTSHRFQILCVNREYEFSSSTHLTSTLLSKEILTSSEHFLHFFIDPAWELGQLKKDTSQEHTHAWVPHCYRL